MKRKTNWKIILFLCLFGSGQKGSVRKGRWKIRTGLYFSRNLLCFRARQPGKKTGSIFTGALHGWPLLAVPEFFSSRYSLSWEVTNIQKRSIWRRWTLGDAHLLFPQVICNRLVGACAEICEAQIQEEPAQDSRGCFQGIERELSAPSTSGSKTQQSNCKKGTQTNFRSVETGLFAFCRVLCWGLSGRSIFNNT